MSRDNQLKALRNRHREDVKRLERQTQELKRQLAEARMTDLLFELHSTFPALPQLVSALRKIHTASVPLKSANWESVKTSTHSDVYTSSRSTAKDRSTAAWVNNRLQSIVDDLAEQLSGRGRLVDDETDTVPAPKCWNPNCPAFAHAQGFDRLEENKGSGTCISCGESFTAFRRPDDKTRCWSRACPQRGHTGACP